MHLPQKIDVCDLSVYVNIILSPNIRAQLGQAWVCTSVVKESIARQAKITVTIIIMPNEGEYLNTYSH